MIKRIIYRTVCLHYKNRTDAGGRVLIYTKSHLALKEMTVLPHPQLESVWVEVSNSKIKYLIGTVYRPPSAPSIFWEILNDNLETALNLSKYEIILGNFNEDLLNPNLHNFKISFY